jgi:hypothetical protein
LGVVQCAQVAAQVTRVTNEDLEKVAMQIGRNQRVQAHGALLLIEPTFLVRPGPNARPDSFDLSRRVLVAPLSSL